MPEPLSARQIAGIMAAEWLFSAGLLGLPMCRCELGTTLITRRNYLMAPSRRSHCTTLTLISIVPVGRQLLSGALRSTNRRRVSAKQQRPPPQGPRAPRPPQPITRHASARFQSSRSASFFQLSVPDHNISQRPAPAQPVETALRRFRLELARDRAASRVSGDASVARGRARNETAASSSSLRPVYDSRLGRGAGCASRWAGL